MPTARSLGSTGSRQYSNSQSAPAGSVATQSEPHRAASASESSLPGPHCFGQVCTRAESDWQHNGRARRKHSWADGLRSSTLCVDLIAIEGISKDEVSPVLQPAVLVLARCNAPSRHSPGVLELDAVIKHHKKANRKQHELPDMAS